MTHWFSPTRLGIAAGTALVLCGGITATYGLYGQIVGRISEETSQVHPACPEEQKGLDLCVGEGKSLRGKHQPSR